jgi:hypothetical protein
MPATAPPKSLSFVRQNLQRGKRQHCACTGISDHSCFPLTVLSSHRSIFCAARHLQMTAWQTAWHTTRRRCIHTCIAPVHRGCRISLGLTRVGSLAPPRMRLQVLSIRREWCRWHRVDDHLWKLERRLWQHHWRRSRLRRRVRHWRSRPASTSRQRRALRGLILWQGGSPRRAAHTLVRLETGERQHLRLRLGRLAFETQIRLESPMRKLIEEHVTTPL